MKNIGVGEQLGSQRLYENQKDKLVSPSFLPGPKIISVGLKSPENIGSIFRLADAAGCRTLIFIHDGDDELIIRDVIGTFDTPELAWVTRIVSVSLRHSTPIEFLVQQLEKEGKINSFNKILARVLKKYIPDGEKVKSNNKCEKCKGNNLFWQEGCIFCLDCGFSKCCS